MGQQQCKQMSVETEYKIFEVREDGCALLKHRSSGQECILRNFNSYLEEQTRQFQQILHKRQQIQSIHLLKVYQTYQKDIKNACSIKHQIYIIAQYPFQTLNDQIKGRTLNKRNQYFDQSQIMSILYSCSMGLNSLYRNQLIHQCLDQSNIFINRSGIIQIGDPIVLGLNKNYISHLKNMNKKIHISPQILNFIQDYNFCYYDKEKSDVFVLAIIILEAALLIKIQPFQILKKSFNINQIPIHLQSLKSIYSSSLISILSKLLQPEPAKRPNFHQIIQIIQTQYQNSHQITPQKNIKQNNHHSTNQSNIISMGCKNNKTPVQGVRGNEIQQFGITLKQIPYCFQPQQNHHEESNLSLNTSIPDKQPNKIQVKHSFVNNAKADPIKKPNIYNPQKKIPSETKCVKQSSISDKINNIKHEYFIFNYQKPLNSQILQQYKTQQQISSSFPHNTYNYAQNHQINSKQKNIQFITFNELKPNPQQHQFYQHPKTQTSILRRLKSQNNTKQQFMQKTNTVSINLIDSPLISKQFIRVQKQQNSTDLKQNQNNSVRIVELSFNQQMITDEEHQRQDSEASFKFEKTLINQSAIIKQVSQESKIFSSKNPSLQIIHKKSKELDRSSKTQVQKLIFVIEDLPGKGRYLGQKLKNKRQGEGRMQFQDGGYYQGNWFNDKMNGFGRLYYQNGQLAYQGYWLNQQFSGKGKIYNDQPQIIEESFFNFSDFTQILDKWVSYEGDFLQNMKHGKGQIKLSNGQVFEGTFVNDVIHGQGCFQKINGQNIRGIWRDNKYIYKN